ncbi:hypothetical protein AAHZ94_34280 [Streptomyces sp. HSW2009]|uniref:hypothetical protein n=1 Tax=Streptomyces sp. HSW2009 TaxID=3142890 RepID=UPI0032EF106E
MPVLTSRLSLAAVATAAALAVGTPVAYATWDRGPAASAAPASVHRGAADGAPRVVLGPAPGRRRPPRPAPPGAPPPPPAPPAPPPPPARPRPRPPPPGPPPPAGGHWAQATTARATVSA